MVISKLNSEICPVRVLTSYIKKGGITDKGKFLFRGVKWLPSKGSYSLREKNKPISYTTARSDMLDMWRDLGLDPNRFGLHSARSGGQLVQPIMGSGIDYLKDMDYGNLLVRRIAM